MDKLSVLMGKNIKKARTAKQWSQEYLAERMGVSISSVSMWESGKRMPSADSIFKLNSLLGTQITNVPHEEYSNTKLQEGQHTFLDFLTSDDNTPEPTADAGFDFDDGDWLFDSIQSSSSGSDNDALTEDEKEMIQAYRNASTSAKMQAYQILIKGAF